MSLSTNPLTRARKAIEARIQTVTLANGSRTDIGTNLCIGWLSEILGTKGLPSALSVIQMASGLPPQKGPHALKVFKGFYVIGLASVGLDNYQDMLDDMELDLLESLVPPDSQPCKWLPRSSGFSGITIGAPEHFPPGSGQKYAGVLIPVHVHTIIQDKS
ncbi:hypothetical protein [Metapseudomonas sp. CR1201]